MSAREDMLEAQVEELRTEVMAAARTLAAIVLDAGGTLFISKKAMVSADVGALENGSMEPDGVRLIYNADWDK